MMAEKITRFEDLAVWQKAHQMVLQVYRITGGFPTEERFGLSSQMRRAAVSVPANPAPGTVPSALHTVFRLPSSRSTDSSSLPPMEQGQIHEFQVLYTAYCMLYSEFCALYAVYCLLYAIPHGHRPDQTRLRVLQDNQADDMVVETVSDVRAGRLAVRPVDADAESSKDD